MKIIRGVATSSGRELFMNERFIFTAAIYLIFAPWSYGQAERNPQMDFGEINEAPLKGILQAIYKPYAWADLPFSLMLGFHIEQDGSLSNWSRNPLEVWRISPIQSPLWAVIQYSPC
jgi:hypothetical protein